MAVIREARWWLVGGLVVGWVVGGIGRENGLTSGRSGRGCVAVKKETRNATGKQLIAGKAFRWVRQSSECCKLLSSVHIDSFSPCGRSSDDP